MTPAAGPRLDEPWRRLPWLTPSALLLWALLLVGFTLLLHDTGRPPESIDRLDARLLDLPAPAPPGGLQGAAEPAPAAAPPPPQPQPQVEPKRAQAPVARPKKKKDAAPPVYDTHGAHTAPAAEADGVATAQAPAAGEANAAGGGVSGHAGSGGLGSDSIGARAIYAPTPTIPDDLRENVFETVALAHFHVSFDGVATVSLVQPTSNPRLNYMLLDILKQWRFFPAIRNGIAIDSEFDVRIPIAVH
jgi:periplasmic protein TonB